MRRGRETRPRSPGSKQEAKQRAGSAKDAAAAAAGGDDDQGGELAAAASPSRQGFAFLHDRRKMATTPCSAWCSYILFSFSIYIRYGTASGRELNPSRDAFMVRAAAPRQQAAGY